MNLIKKKHVVFCAKNFHVKNSLMMFTRSVILGKVPTSHFLIRRVQQVEESVKINSVQAPQLIVEERLSCSAAQSQIVN